MARPRCWLCFKQLMYVKGKPVFATVRDAEGVERKVHKACLFSENAARDEEQSRDFAARSKPNVRIGGAT